MSVWPKPESRLEIGIRKIRDYRGGAVLSDAEADAVIAYLDLLKHDMEYAAALPAVLREPGAEL